MVRCEFFSTDKIQSILEYVLFSFHIINSFSQLDDETQINIIRSEAKNAELNEMSKKGRSSKSSSLDGALEMKYFDFSV